MRNRLMSWFAGTVLIVVLFIGPATGCGQPSITHAEEQSTPTPTVTTGPEGEPGGNGGGRY
jgi:hypothetical protein